MLAATLELFAWRGSDLVLGGKVWFRHWQLAEDHWPDAPEAPLSAVNRSRVGFDRLIPRRPRKHGFATPTAMLLEICRRLPRDWRRGGINTATIG